MTKLARAGIELSGKLKAKRDDIKILTWKRVIKLKTVVNTGFSVEVTL